MTEAVFSGGFSSSFGTAGAVDSVIAMLYKHGKDISVNPQQGVTVRHGPYPVGPTLHPTSTWKNTESGSFTAAYISKDKHNSVKTVTNVPLGIPRQKRPGKWQSQAEANAEAYFNKHKKMAKYWTVVPFKVSWDVMIVRWEYVDGVLGEFQGALEASYQRIAALQQKAKSFGAGSEGLAKIEVEIGRIQQQMFETRKQMRGILAFRAMFEGIVVIFNCRVTALSSWGEWKLNAPQNCTVKMTFGIRPHEKNGKTGMSIDIKWDERMPGWSRIKEGKLELQGGKFKSFTGAIADAIPDNLRKISNPDKTYADATPSPLTATMKADYEKSTSWMYLTQVAAGQDPDISMRSTAARKRRDEMPTRPAVNVEPGAAPTVASTDARSRRSRRTVAPTPTRWKAPADGEEIDLSEVMKEIGASPSKATAPAAASRPNPSADKRKRRTSRTKVQYEDPETSESRPHPSTDSGPKRRSGARVRTGRAET